MATYISDEETCRLIQEYARLEGKSKTAALRDLLRNEIENAQYRAGATERYEKVMARLNKRQAKLKGRVPDVPKQVFDDLFEIQLQRNAGRSRRSLSRESA